MKRPEAEKLGDNLSKYMIDHIREHGDLEMTIHVISGDKTRVLKGFDPNSGNQKALMAELARYLAKKHRAESIVLSCESFTAHSEKASVDELNDLQAYREKNGTIEGHPLTFEALFLAIEIRSDMIVRCYPFIRDENGAVNEVKDPIPFPEGAAMDGTLVNMLDPTKKMPVPDEVLAEMESKLVEVIPTKALGVFISEGHAPSFH